MLFNTISFHPLFDNIEGGNRSQANLKIYFINFIDALRLALWLFITFFFLS